MNPTIPMTIAALALVYTVLKFRAELQRRGNELTALVRNSIDPPYAITPEEIKEESQRRLKDPQASLVFSLNTMSRQLGAIWSKYPNNQGLQKASRSVRMTIYRYVVTLIAIFVLMVLAVVLTHSRL